MINKRLWQSFGVAALIYGAMYFSISTQNIVSILNSIVIGSGFVLFISYWPTLWLALKEADEYNRERHYIIGMFLAWIAIYLFISNSILIRTSLPDSEIANVDILATLARYVAIVSIAFQVTAPDFGESMFYGRDRRLLWVGMIGGAIIGVLSAIMQNAQ